jgi:cytochrome P450
MSATAPRRQESSPVDFASTSFIADPWPVYRRLRRDDPVHYSPQAGCHVAVRHAEVRSGLADPVFRANFLLRRSRQVFGDNLLDLDGEEHRRLRHLIAPLFGPRAIKRYMAEIVGPLVESSVAALPAGEPVDVVEEFAAMIPYGLMCRLMGVPGTEVEWLYRRMRPIVGVLDYPPAVTDQALAARDEIREFMRDLADRATACEPSDGGLVARLAARNVDESPVDLLSTLLLILLAGTETSISGISNIMYALAAHDPRMDSVRRGEEAAGRVVRESLRWEPPLHSVLRFADDDVELGGLRLGRHQPVLFSLGSANRDESVFPDPDTWDPGRDTRAMLMTFGSGPHACPGMGLAEEEFRFIVQQLSRSFGTIEFAGSPPGMESHSFRRPGRLDLVLTP